MAATQVLEILIKARDDASKQLGKVQKQSKSLNTQLKGMRTQLLAVSAVGVGLGVASIKLASDLEEARAAAEQTFKTSAEVVTKFADEQADAFNVSRSSAFEYTAQLGAIFNASGLNAQAAAESSVRFVKLAADLASFRNLRFEDALQKIRAGLVGEAEPLRTVGVLLSAARVQQVAYAEGIAETGAKLTESQKVAARQIIIMGDLADAQGDVARTSQSVANLAKDAQQQMADLGAEIGTQLLPVAAALLKIVSELLGFFRDLPDPIKDFTLVLGGVITAMALLGLAIPPVISAMALLGVTSNIALAGIPLAIAAIITALGLLIFKTEEVIEFFKGAGGWILSFMGTLGVAAKLIIDNFELLIRVLRDTFNAAVFAFNTIVAHINRVIDSMNLVAEVFGQEIPSITFELERWEEAMENTGKTISSSTQDILDANQDLGGSYQELTRAVREELGELSELELEHAVAVASTEATFAQERIRRRIEFRQAVLEVEASRRAASEAAAQDETERLIAGIKLRHELQLVEEEKQSQELADLEQRRKDMRDAIREGRVSAAAGIGGSVISSVGRNLDELRAGRTALAGGLISSADRAAQLGLTGSAAQDFIERQDAAQGRFRDRFAPDVAPAVLPGAVTIVVEGNVTSEAALDELERGLMELQRQGRS